MSWPEKLSRVLEAVAGTEELEAIVYYLDVELQRRLATPEQAHGMPNVVDVGLTVALRIADTAVTVAMTPGYNSDG